MRNHPTVDALYRELVTARDRQLQARISHQPDACGVDAEKRATRWLDVLLDRLWGLMSPAERAQVTARPVRCERVQGLR